MNDLVYHTPTGHESAVLTYASNVARMLTAAILEQTRVQSQVATSATSPVLAEMYDYLLFGLVHPLSVDLLFAIGQQLEDENE